MRITPERDRVGSLPPASQDSYAAELAANMIIGITNDFVQRGGRWLRPATMKNIPNNEEPPQKTSVLRRKPQDARQPSPRTAFTTD
jgi:hypothetical protein